MEIVRRTVARYGSLETYAAEGVVREDVVLDSGPQVQETRFSIRLGRPASYRILWRRTLNGRDWDGAVRSSKIGPRVRLGAKPGANGGLPANVSGTPGSRPRAALRADCRR
jgi:hypothetical protein